jgi:hypothetical protein
MKLTLMKKEKEKKEPFIIYKWLIIQRFFIFYFLFFYINQLTLYV